MSAEPSSLETIASLLGGALEPLVQALAAEENVRQYVAQIGWDLPEPAPPAFAGLTSSLEGVVQAFADLQQQRVLVAEGEADDDTLLPKFGSLLVAVLAFTTELGRLPDNLRAQLPPAYLSESGIADAIIERLLEDTAVRALANAAPLATALLELGGLVDAESVAADAARHQTDYVSRRLRFDRLSTFLNDPAAVAREVYGWGTPALDGDRLFAALERVGFALLIPAHIRYPSPDALAALTPGVSVPVDTGPDPMLVVPLASVGGLALELGVFPAPKLTPGELQGLAFALGGSASFAGTLPVAPNLALSIDATLDLTNGLGVVLRPDGPPRVVTSLASGGAAALSGHALVKLAYERDDEQPTRLLSMPGGSRLEIQSADVGIGVSDEAGDLDVLAQLDLTGGKLVIATDEADGFLAHLLPSDGIAVNFDFGVAWSQKGGLRFSGGAALETTLSLGLALGPFRIDSVTLALAAKAEGIDLALGVTGGGVIGPVSASVDKLGLASALAFHSGNLGPVDLSFAFKPPAGLGLAIDAGPVSGGGYVFFDPDAGRYAGVLQLSVYAVSITVIGLIDTRLPGGQPGFSFLLVVCVEFTPIQLGFGFTLNGVGGLAGINRTFVTEALQAGVRAGTLDHVLFPHDVVRNAPQIISDIRTIFPPAQGRYVFGPMAIIGWGTPTLIEAKLGILLEIPSPVVLAILGQINVNLPAPDAPVVELHLDVLGVIDFGQKLFSLDATLHDSRVAFLTISGDMAFRLAWGENSSFALSIGGFNPHFTPPPGFPDLRRLTLGLNVGDAIRVTIQGYFALTSNTLQLGVKAEAYLGAGDFNVYGWLGFDALLIFTPFSFIVDFTAGLALRSGTSTLLGISLAGSFSGPTPWHVEGTASVSLLFFDISVHVSQDFGEARSNELPSTNAWPPLRDALREPRNWAPALDPALPRIVTLAEPEASGGGSGGPLLFDPSGGASVRQRVLPLNLELEKFGEAKPEGQTLFTIDAVALGSDPTDYSVVNEEFARGQFKNLSDAQKLSLPSFEPMQAGIAIADDSVAVGRELDLSLDFETIYVDSVSARRLGTRYALPLSSLLAYGKHAPAATSALVQQGLSRFRAGAEFNGQVVLAPEHWVVATSDDLTLVAEVTGPTTKGTAFDALERHLQTHPEDRGRLQVVALHELESAA